MYLHVSLPLTNNGKDFKNAFVFPLQRKLRGLRSKTTHHLPDISQCVASILSFAPHPVVFSLLTTHVCYPEAGAKVAHSCSFKNRLEKGNEEK